MCNECPTVSDMLELLSLGPFSEVMERAGLFLSPLKVTRLNWLDSVATVSYTHLDVYKRQSLLCATV